MNSPRIWPDQFKTGSDAAGAITFGVCILLSQLFFRLPIAYPSWAYGVMALGAIGLIAGACGRMRSPILLILLGMLIAGATFIWVVLLFVANDRRSQNDADMVRLLMIGLPLVIGTMFVCTRLKPWWLRFAVPAVAMFAPIPIAIFLQA